MNTEIQSAVATRTVTVADIFRDRDPRYVRQYADHDVIEWYVDPTPDKGIAIDFSSALPLGEYMLPEHMRARDMQVAARAMIMTETAWLRALYALLVEPELGVRHFSLALSRDRRYLFNVRLDGGDKVTFHLYYGGNRWVCYQYRFRRVRWFAGNILIHEVAPSGQFF